MDNQSDTMRLLRKGRHATLKMLFGRTLPVALALLVQVGLIVSFFIYLEPYFKYAYWVGAAVSILFVTYLVNRNMDASLKVSWILLATIFPAVAAALYVMSVFDPGYHATHKRLYRLIEDTKDLLPQSQEAFERLEAEQPDAVPLARYAMRAGGFPVYDGTDAHYYPIGEDALEGMLEAIRSAEHFIFLEFFIVDEGEMWGRILKLLEQKAQEGVDVRLLYDGTCALFRLPYRYPDQIRALGIQCRMFCPIRPVISTVYNNRDHRKILVVDGKTAFTGGVNLADEYINIGSRFGHWKDVFIRYRGDAAAGFTLMFLQMWNINAEQKDDFSRYLMCAERSAKPSGFVIPYADSPLDDERVGEQFYLDIIHRAKHYLHIMTPYLILDDTMLNALCFAAKRGVDVRILLPHIPDKKYAFALAKTHYDALMAAGVRMYEYTPGFVHAEVFVSDDRIATVGTINLDYRSLYLHFECGSCLIGSDEIPAIEADYQKTLAKSREVQKDDWKKEPFGTKLLGRIAKLLAPLM